MILSRHSALGRWRGIPCTIILHAVSACALAMSCGCTDDRAATEASALRKELQTKSTYVIPSFVTKAIKEADSLKLFSLDPAQPQGDVRQGLEGWVVRGEVEITGSAAGERINELLLEAVRERSSVALCFDPRHAIRASRGNSVVEVVISFECHWAEVFLNGEKLHMFPIGGSPQAELDKLLRGINAGPAPAEVDPPKG